MGPSTKIKNSDSNTHTYIIITAVFPGKPRLGSWPLELRGFAAKFYGTDALPDAESHNELHHFCIHANAFAFEGEELSFPFASALSTPVANSTTSPYLAPRNSVIIISNILSCMPHY